MNIKAINNLINSNNIKPNKNVKPKDKDKFLQMIQKQLKEVNELQNEAGRKINEFATGDIKNVHDVMIAMEKADVSFNLMVEIRNKLIQSYKEIMKMQV